MTTTRICKKCKKIIIVSFNNFKGYPSWKDSFKEEDLCRCIKEDLDENKKENSKQ